MSGRRPSLRGSIARSAARIAVSQARARAIPYLRRRLFPTVTTKRKSLYMGRRASYGRRRVLRRYKAHKRTLPSTRQRSHCIETYNAGATEGTPPFIGTTGLPLALNYLTANQGQCLQRKIYIKAIPYPLPTVNTSGEEINAGNPRARDGNNILLNGFKIQRTFSLSTSAAGPWVVNWALIQFKQNEFGDSTELGTDLLYNRFFRSFVDRDDETTSFSEVGGQGANLSNKWSLDHNINAINPDSNFRIITHKRRVLVPYNVTNFASQTNKGSWRAPHEWNINAYYKVKKIQSFNTNAATVPEQVICEIWWAQAKEQIYMGSANEFHLTTYNKNRTYWAELA